MNERIYELIRLSAVPADQAKDYALAEGLVEPTEKLDVAKFAELIVKECVRYFNEDYQRDFDTLWREDLTKGIKDHFGVEE